MYDVKKEVKELLDLLNSIKTTKVLITGHPDSIDEVKTILDNHKESFLGYIFEYYSSKSFEVGQIYLIPGEYAPPSIKIKFDYDEEK